MVYDRAAKTIKDLLPKFDNWADEFAWRPDSKLLFVISETDGVSKIFATNLDGITFDLNIRSGAYSNLHPLVGSVHSGEGSTPINWSTSESAIIATQMSVKKPSEVVRLSFTHD